MAAPFHPSGYAKPLIYVYDGADKLLNNRFGKPIGQEVTNFYYEYNEDGDDKCEIDFQTDDVYLPDNKALQIDNALFIKWGYVTIEGKRFLSPKRQIAIRDVEIDYRADKINVKLKCTDCVSYIKEMQHNEVRKGNFVDWLSEMIEGKYTATIVLQGTSKTITYNDRQPALESKTTGNVTVVRDKTAVPEDIKFLSNNHVIKGHSRAIHKAIEDEIKFAEEGPLSIGGRDCTLIIRDKGYNSPIFKTFQYGQENGGVISCKIRTNYKGNAIENAKVSTVDPDTGEIHYVESDYSDTAEIEQAERGLTYGGHTFSSAEVFIYVNQLKEIMAKRMKSGNILADDEEAWNKNLSMLPELTYKETKRSVFNDVKGSDEIKTEGGLSFVMEARISTAAPIPVIQEIDIRVPPSRVFGTTVGQDALEYLLRNEVMERNQRKREAQIIAIGDPLMESSKMIRLDGVSKGYSGEWYVVKVKHHINDNNGYTINMEALQKPAETIVTKGNYLSQIKESLKKAEEMDTGPEELEVVRIIFDKYNKSENKHLLEKDGYSSVLEVGVLGYDELVDKARSDGLLDSDTESKIAEITEQRAANDDAQAKFQAEVEEEQARQAEKAVNQDITVEEILNDPDIDIEFEDGLLDNDF